MAAANRRRTTSIRKASTSWTLALTLAAVAAVVGVGALLWSRTGGGQAALRQPGAEQFYCEVQERIEQMIGAVLPDLAQTDPAPDAYAWPLESVGPTALIRCRVVAYDGDLTWWQLQEFLTAIVQQGGGRILWGERLPRSHRARDMRQPVETRDLLRLDVGLPGRPTHTLVLYRRQTPRPSIRWGQDPQADAWKQLQSEAVGPVVALVIDDWGNRQDATTSGLLALDVPLTLAILPGQPYSRRFALEGTDLALPYAAGGPDGNYDETAAAARLAAGCPVALDVGSDPIRLPAQRREVILHLPMQPHDYPRVDPGPRALLVGMSRRQIATLLDECLASLPAVRGVSNHMGSAATADEPTMQALMEELRARELIFLDSLTIASSVAYPTALAAGVPAARNRIFLDHDHQDRRSIRDRLRTLIGSARATGFAVGIGHPHPATLQVLGEEIAALRAEGVVFVTLSEYLALRSLETRQTAHGG